MFTAITSVFPVSARSHTACCRCAGDNALDYVIEGATVSAVDFNPCQIALCELKVRFWVADRRRI